MNTQKLCFIFFLSFPLPTQQKTHTHPFINIHRSPSLAENITLYLKRRLTSTPLANCPVLIQYLLKHQLFLWWRTREIEALAGHTGAVALLRGRVKLCLLVVGTVQRVAVGASAFEGQRCEACDSAGWAPDEGCAPAGRGWQI